jgi:RNA polymerase sigma-70 factor, ECF subfamily
MDHVLGMSLFNSCAPVISDETKLIAAAQRGELEAFGELALAHHPWLYATAYYLLRDADAADDATQEALIAAYRSLPAFGGGSLKGWLYRIVTRKCYDQLRDLRRRRSTSWDALAETHAARWPSLDELPEPAVQRRELAHRLEAGLNCLPIQERQMVVMRAMHGLNYAEIAAATDRPVGTVKSKLSRARAKLRLALGAVDSTAA